MAMVDVLSESILLKESFIDVWKYVKSHSLEFGLGNAKYSILVRVLIRILSECRNSDQNSVRMAEFR